MTPEEQAALQAELARLRERNRKLAEDKAFHQLVLRLIERLDPLPGLEDMLRNMLFAIVESLGGTNIKVYYWMGEELHYQDFLGEKRRLPAIDDPDVAKVRETRTFVEKRGEAEDALLMHGMLRGSWTWTFPLLVGQELVGIVKLENLHIHGATLGRYLPTFFSHAALILGNEIRNAAHRRSEADLRVATERLRLAAEAGLIGIWDWDVERDELVWDASMYRLYGLAQGDFGGAYEAWIRAVHPDDKAHADAEIQAALRGEREYGPEFRVVWPDGSIHHVQAASRTLRDASGKALRMVGINYDLTERRRAEEAQRRLNRELRALGRCNEALLRAVDERTLLLQICRIVCDEAGYRMAWVGYAEQDEARTIRPVAWAGAEDGYLRSAPVSWAEGERGRGAAGTAIRTGEKVCIPDLAADPRMAPWAEPALVRGYRSGIALPLRDESGTFGVLCIYSGEAGALTPDETRLLEELAGDLAFGITVLRARTRLEEAERERAGHLRFLESMDRVNRAIQGADALEKMMADVLDVLLSVFGCDRAFLLYPCEPEAPTWRVSMERTRGEAPGARAPSAEQPMDPDATRTLRLLLAADGPVAFGPGTSHPLPADLSDRYGFRSFLSMALRPRTGKPWQLGIVQCADSRTWTAEEERLLQEIGRRLADALTGLLVVRDLRESEQKLARTERIVHVGYWDRNLVAGRIELSEEACRIFGLPPEERVLDLQGWHAHWERLLHPDDRPGAAQAYARALEGGPRYDVEYRIVRPGGEVRFVHSQADITRDESGRAIRVLGTMQDVTARKQAEEEIRELNQKLEQRVAERTAELAAANRELEAFAYSVSHDLRAPLRAIDGYRGLLQKRIAGQLDEQGKRYLDSISESANRMGQLIDDLLSFSRMGRVEMAQRQVNLGALARDVIEELRPDEAGRAVDWRLGELPAVTGDQAMLRVVLVNLLSNALKFTRSRERAVIEVGSRRGASGETEVFVRDNGVGFDMAYVEKLFGVFHRLHRAEEFEGTGIGLANVRRIVARHGGRTWAEAKAGQGATFWFSLPPAG